MKYDLAFIAQLNKKNVLNVIRTRGPISKSQIAKLLDLSLPTVMKISDELSEAGIVKSIGKGESRGGKRPELIELIPDAYYMVGVDIGRSRTISIIMDLNGDVLFRKTMETGQTNPPSELLDRVEELIKFTIDESKLQSNKLLGIGIVTPGLMDIDNGIIIFSPDFQWENVEIKKNFGQFFHLPVILENSNRALALSEGWFGAAEKAKYFVCINLGYGIGSAIMEKEKFYLGNSGSSGELGHMTLEKEGPKCDCGNNGCLEALASGKAIADRAKEAIANGTDTIILKYVDGNINKIEAKEVFEAAKAGDKCAKEIIDKAIEYLGIGIANYINLLDPEMIVLAGGMTKNGSFFLDKLEKAISERKMKFAGGNVKLEISKLGEDAAAMGAATLILKRFIEHGGDTMERRQK